jgi:hypothetical protein
MNSEVRPFISLSDDELLTETKRLVACERRATAALLRSLMEVDSRRLYLREGYSSLFTYCTQVLHLGEGAAYNRIEAARAARRFPSVLPALENGSLTLASVRLLAPHLTQETHDALMAAARHKSKRDVELLVATVASKPPAATVVRRLPEKPQLAPASTGSRLALSYTTSSASGIGVSGADPSGPRAAGDESPDRAARAATTRPSLPPHAVTPLSAAHYRLQVTMTPETHDKLRRAQDLLRHAVPDGDLGAVLDRALTLLVADLERRRCASTPAPRASSPGTAGGRYIPSAVRRAVWKRDAGRCAFVGGSGRCTETGWLELHHVQPYAEGGGASVENIQLRCRAHNQHEARLWFGPGCDEVKEAGVGYASEVGITIAATTNARHAADSSRGRFFVATQASHFAPPVGR